VWPCAVLIVTHDIAEAASLADRIVVLTGPGPRHSPRVVEIPAARRRSGLAEGARVAAALI
jgi:ABC-type nitrate/sulfonate/bicarbonate transport system ATPase subunit